MVDVNLSGSALPTATRRAKDSYTRPLNTHTMSKATDERARSIEGLDVVVDADAHVREGFDDLVPYIDERYGAVRKIVEATERPLADIYSITHATPPFPFAENVQEGGSSDNVGGEYAPGEKLEELREFGIDYGVLDPTLNLGLPTVENPQMAVALANAYNSWILDTYTDDNEAFVSNVLVSHKRPAEAAEEIDRRADEDDMVGVQIPSTGVLPPLGDPQYDPIYEAAEDNGLPVVLHGGNLATSHAFPTQRQWNESYTENHVITHPFGHMWHASTMLVRGVPARFPDLDFVFQEAGVAWVPYFVWRMDDHYLELSHEFHLDRLPSEYVEEQFHFTTQPLGHTKDPTHLARAIELAGPDNVMYASDLPHSDFDPPEELFARIDGQFEAATVRGMMGETAADVFDLPL